MHTRIWNPTYNSNARTHLTKASHQILEELLDNLATSYCSDPTKIKPIKLQGISPNNWELDVQLNRPNLHQPNASMTS